MIQFVEYHTPFILELLKYICSTKQENQTLTMKVFLVFKRVYGKSGESRVSKRDPGASLAGCKCSNETEVLSETHLATYNLVRNGQVVYLSFTLKFKIEFINLDKYEVKLQFCPNLKSYNVTSGKK